MRRRSLAGRTAARLLGLFVRLGGLFVRVAVEEDKQDQVAHEDAETREGRRGFAVAVAHVRHPWRIQVNVVVVDTVDAHDDVDDELYNLTRRDELLPWAPDANAGERIVAVHDDVHGEIQADDDPRQGGLVHDLGVAQGGGSHVVIHVQEEQLLLLEHEKERVGKLPVFEVVVDDVEHFRIKVQSVLTDRVVHAILENNRNLEFEVQAQEQQASETQKDVVQEEGDLEHARRHRRQVPHHSLTTQHDRDVSHRHGHHRHDRRERRHARLPKMHRCRVAHNARRQQRLDTFVQGHGGGNKERAYCATALFLAD